MKDEELEKRPLIKNIAMDDPRMKQDAIDISIRALEIHSVETDIACYIKKEFDKIYKRTWHCIVGKDFGSYVSHERNRFIYFYVGKTAILLFKS